MIKTCGLYHFSIGLAACLCLQSVSAQTNYTNPLTNSNSLGSSSFLYLSDTNAGALKIDPNGLSFTNATNKPFFASYFYLQPLPASNSWTAKVRVHISNFLFSSGGNGAWIWGGLTLFKYTNSANTNDIINYATSQGNIAAKFVRTEDLNNALTNLFVSKFESLPFNVSGEDLMAPSPTNSVVTDLWVSLTFESLSKRITYSYSRDGTNYWKGPSWNLGERWGITDSNSFVVGLTAENADLKDPNQSIYAVKAGELYLRDFSVVFTPSSSSRVLSLEGTTNLSSPWTAIPLSSDHIDGSGNLNIGASASTNTNNFYRMRIRVQP